MPSEDNADKAAKNPAVQVALTGQISMVSMGTLTVTVHGPLPDDHPFYALIGRVASSWAHLEHILDVTIWHMAPINPAMGACITAQMMGVGPRCKAIISLTRLDQRVPESARKSLRQLMSDSYVVADLRARFVHDPWYIERVSDRPAQFRSMPYSDPRYGFQEITEAEATDTLKKISDLRDRATAIKQEILNALGTST